MVTDFLKIPEETLCMGWYSTKLNTNPEKNTLRDIKIASATI